MKINWTHLYEALAIGGIWYLLLFLGVERGVIELKGYRVERARDPDEYRFQFRWCAFLGLALMTIIYLVGL